MLGNGGKDAEGKIPVTVLLKVCTYAMICPARTPNGKERTPLEREQELETGKCIEPETDAHDGFETLLRQILVQEQQVVAEIEECLARVALREGSASQMVDDAVGDAYYATAAGAQSPAQVYLLLMCKETVIQSACCLRIIIQAPVAHITGTMVLYCP